MQLIAEAYALLKGGLALSNEELAQTFTEWNEGELSMLPDRHYQRYLHQEG
ncbi:hypothetical protein LNP20_03610 [Klebsiella pneumoniae subsp. pneumoniae]|nr:hypothetical protein [Klebsiella pneumoniae subsp. pneumoniae]